MTYTHINNELGLSDRGIKRKIRDNIKKLVTLGCTYQFNLDEPLNYSEIVFNELGRLFLIANTPSCKTNLKLQDSYMRLSTTERNLLHSCIEVPSNHKRSNTLYIFKMEIHEYTVYKIGITAKVSKRLTTTQTYAPFKVEVLFKAKVSNAIAIEKLLHLKYADKNTNGEWFELSENDIEDIKNQVNNIKV